MTDVPTTALERAAAEMSYQMGDGSLGWRKYVELLTRLIEMAQTDRKVEILHERDPDSGCDITVWVDGVEVKADVVDIDPGRGHEREDWDESAAYAVADERDRSYTFKCAISRAYDVAGQSKYIDG